MLKCGFIKKRTDYVTHLNIYRKFHYVHNLQNVKNAPRKASGYMNNAKLTEETPLTAQRRKQAYTKAQFPLIFPLN